MTKRTKVLDDDDDPPWEGLRPPPSRASDPIRYIRSELGWAMCRRWPALDCVILPCPVEDEDEDEDEHTVSICRAGECDNVRISCAEGHSSADVILAIIERLMTAR